MLGHSWQQQTTVCSETFLHTSVPASFSTESILLLHVRLQPQRTCVWAQDITLQLLSSACDDDLSFFVAQYCLLVQDVQQRHEKLVWLQFALWSLCSWPTNDTFDCSTDLYIIENKATVIWCWKAQLLKVQKTNVCKW